MNRPGIDAELVALARSGDSRAGDELARRYRRSAYLLALQLLRDPDDAMDVTQDALLRFFSNLDRFDGRREVAPWLYTIVRNRARDVMRRRRRRPVEHLDSGDEDRPAPEVIDQRPGPDADAERRELQARIWQALFHLPEAQREILVLRDYQDLSYDEISHVLRIPAGTVMSRLHRARKNLKEILETGGPRA